MLVLDCMIRTLTPGITAPVPSETTPEMPPVSTCAMAAHTKARISRERFMKRETPRSRYDIRFEWRPGGLKARVASPSGLPRAFEPARDAGCEKASRATL